jgi:ribonucleoside-diphosphate reductase alpha chain
MYMYAWEKGLKTTYYLRSRPATSINKVTLGNSSESLDEPAATPANSYTAAEAIACSLENPEACEACT